MSECAHGYPELRRCPWCKHTVSSPVAVLDHGNWHAQAVNALAELAASGLPFTSEDLTARVGFPAEHAANRNNRVGLLIQTHARRLGLRRIAMVKARNPQSNGRLIQQWVGRR